MPRKLVHDQPQLFDPHAGVTGAASPETSHMAAASVEDVTGRLNLLVMAAIRRAGPPPAGGRTDDELEVELELKHQTASARRWELARKGLIVRSGYRRPTRSGRQADVWTLPEWGPGEEAGEREPLAPVIPLHPDATMALPRPPVEDGS